MPATNGLGKIDNTKCPACLCLGAATRVRFCCPDLALALASFELPRRRQGQRGFGHQRMFPPELKSMMLTEPGPDCSPPLPWAAALAFSFRGYCRARDLGSLKLGRPWCPGTVRISEARPVSPRVEGQT